MSQGSEVQSLVAPKVFYTVRSLYPRCDQLLRRIREEKKWEGKLVILWEPEEMKKLCDIKSEQLVAFLDDEEWGAYKLGRRDVDRTPPWMRGDWIALIRPRVDLKKNGDMLLTARRIIQAFSSHGFRRECESGMASRILPKPQGPQGNGRH